VWAARSNADPGSAQDRAGATGVTSNPSIFEKAIAAIAERRLDPLAEEE
jgi:transaldolase